MIQSDVPQVIQATNTDVSLIEWVKLIAPIVGIVVNVALTITLFRLIRKVTETNTSKAVNISWFKALILDHNLDHFYEFFDRLEEELLKLQSNNLTDATKTVINENLKNHQRVFRQKFVDMLLAVDLNIYQNILRQTDDLIDSFTTCIFDPGIVLSHPPKFEEAVTKRLSEVKTGIIRELFKYQG